MQSYRILKVVHVQFIQWGMYLFHGNPSKSCGNFALKTPKANLMVALEETLGDHQSQYRIYHLGPMNVCTTFRTQKQTQTQGDGCSVNLLQ